MRNPTAIFAFVTSLVVATFPAAGLAQVVSQPEAVVLEGDAVAGVGVVTRIDNLAINSDGVWLVEADTDNADTDTDTVLLRDGVLLLREGGGLPLPAGAVIDSFDSVGIDDDGDSGWNFFIDPFPSNEDSGIYFNSALVIREGDISSALAFTPGTPYIGFFDVKNNTTNLLLAVASIDDPAISSSVDRALVRILVSDAGVLQNESVLAKEGDILAGQTEPVADFGTGPHQSAINDLGQVLFFADLTGDTSVDGAIYLDGTLLAREGSPSPVAGRNYQFLSSRGLDLNNVGGYVFKANLDGDTADDDILVVNGAVLVREGDSIPAIGGFSFTSFGSGSGPVMIDDGGDVLWFGDWDDPDTDRDTGLFLNDRLIVQEGVTLVDGLVVDTISSGSDAFDMSDDGSFILFEATLEGGINGAFRIEVSDPTGGENPPVAVCTNVTLEVEDTCALDASIDGGSFDPDGDPITLSQSPPGPYPIGATEVTLTVTDSTGLTDTCTGTVTIVDPIPPTITVSIDPPEVWPPNHRMMPVEAIVVATDNCSTPTVVLTAVTSSEPDNGEGDGDTVDDIRGAEVGEADFAFELRAERSGQGDGRTYTATYVATDGSGNQTAGDGTAFVPHDQGGVTEPIEAKVTNNGNGTKLEWDDVRGASHYNVIRGELASIRVTADAYRLGHVQCIAARRAESDTEGYEDPSVPAPGKAFFYLVEFVEDGRRSGFGTESAAMPREIDTGDCD